MNRLRWLKSLYVQVVIGVVLGVLVGRLRPDWGEHLKPLGDGFIKLVKMLIAPIIFGTVVGGIARMRDLRKVGRVGGKALLYFEVVSTVALFIGLFVGKLVRPGAGINADPAALDAKAVEGYAHAGTSLHTVDFLLNVIPSTIVDAFAKGEILQVLLFSVLLGASLAALGGRAEPLIELIHQLTEALFGVVGLIMRLAPLGAFGAMAFTVAKFGLGALASLGELMACFYATALLFVIVVLGSLLRLSGLRLWPFLRYIKEEILVVLATSSSESVLPRIMKKLEDLGCGESTVGLVVPLGYSFNLDGTSIYLTLATLFIAQALNIDLPLTQELTLLLVLMLTSKGAAAVTGGGFITLAATLASTGTLPVAGLALILGIDRFMSEARAITNLIGNAVATVMISRWENELDVERARDQLRQAGWSARAPQPSPDV